MDDDFLLGAALLFEAVAVVLAVASQQFWLSFLASLLVFCGAVFLFGIIASRSWDLQEWFLLIVSLLLMFFAFDRIVLHVFTGIVPYILVAIVLLAWLTVADLIPQARLVPRAHPVPQGESSAQQGRKTDRASQWLLERRASLKGKVFLNKWLHHEKPLRQKGPKALTLSREQHLQDERQFPSFAAASLSKDGTKAAPLLQGKRRRSSAKHRSILIEKVFRPRIFPKPRPARPQAVSPPLASAPAESSTTKTAAKTSPPGESVQVWLDLIDEKKRLREQAREKAEAASAEALARKKEQAGREAGQRREVESRRMTDAQERGEPQDETGGQEKEVLTNEPRRGNEDLLALLGLIPRRSREERAKATVQEKPAVQERPAVQEKPAVVEREKTPQDSALRTCGHDLEDISEIEEKLLQEKQPQEMPSETAVLTNVPQSPLPEKTDAHHEPKSAQTVERKSLVVASSNGSKFHLVSCMIAKRIPKEKRLVFDSAEQGVKEGYIACGVCNPLKAM